jgi:acyl carrier protein
MKKFLKGFKEAFGIEDREINLSDRFREYPEWESIALLSLIAMMDEDYDVMIEVAEFNQIITVGDLWDEIKKRSGNE